MGLLSKVPSALLALQDRLIFPISLRVTRLSGTGQESVFMGVMRCVFNVLIDSH
jgi:hypothetical protein